MILIMTDGCGNRVYDIYEKQTVIDMKCKACGILLVSAKLVLIEFLDERYKRERLILFALDNDRQMC